MTSADSATSDPRPAEPPTALRGWHKWHSKLERAWPRPCDLCGTWCTSPLCRHCVLRFAQPEPRCVRCAIRLATGDATCGACLQHPPEFDRAVAAVDYAWPWNELLSRFKFRAQPELAALLAERMIDAIDRQGTCQADLLVPIPLSNQRLGERGYNQSWELARRIGQHFGIATLATGLTRGRDTAHQVGLERAARETNLRHSMWTMAQTGSSLRGRRVALVDDVLTTGATASVAAEAIRDAGALHVQVWVLARTPSPG